MKINHKKRSALKNSFLLFIFAILTLIPTQTNLAQKSIIYVDIDATGANNGSSWTNAYTSLQTALSVAQNGTEIWVAEGVYKPAASAVPTATFTLVSGVALYGGFAGTETAREQRNWSAHLSVLSGDLDNNDRTDAHGILTDTTGITGTNAYHVVMNTNVISTTVLDGFTITGGNANLPAVNSKHEHSMCAGIKNSMQSNAQLNNLTISGNYALEVGGGLCTGSGDELRYNNLIFIGNRAQSFGGGAILINSHNLTFSNAQFYNNEGYNGGAILISNSYTKLDIINAVMIANRATNNGGAIDYESGTENLHMVNTLMVGNTAKQGGAIYASYGGLTEFHQVTIVGNSASNRGGAIYTSDSNNLSAFKNSILWNNTAPNGNGTTAGGAQSFTYSLVQGSGGSANWNTSYGTNNGGNIDADPHFRRNPDSGDGNWATRSDNDYGNLILQSDSPAIDAGDNAAVPPDFADLDGDANITELLPRDLGGNFRFVDLPDHPDTGSGTAPIIDMGAYETPSFNYTYFTYLPLTLKKGF